MKQDFYWDIVEIKNTKEFINFIETNKEEMKRYDWLLITKKEFMTDEIMEKYSERVDWEYYCTFKKNLSETFLEKNIGVINWYAISRFQNLSIKFIKKYEDRLSFDKLLINDNIRKTKALDETLKMYQERAADPEYLQIWEENFKNSMFSKIFKKGIKAAPKEIIDPLKFRYTDEMLIRMNKKELKEVLHERNIRVYYHDTLDVLKNKIRESQGEKNGSIE